MRYIPHRLNVSVGGSTVALLVLALGSALAQAPAPPPGQALPPVEPRSAIDGTVVQYLMNHHGEVDGLLLSDGTQVHLPPHMAKDVVSTVKPNDTVTVQGYRIAEGPVIAAPIITNTKTGRSITEHEPTAFDRARVPPYVKDMFMAEKHAQGIVRTVLYGPRGEVNGVVLDNHTIVRIPPHAASRVASLLQQGQPLEAVGYGTENQYGVAIEATAVGPTGSALTPIHDPGSGGIRR